MFFQQKNCRNLEKKINFYTGDLTSQFKRSCFFHIFLRYLGKKILHRRLLQWLRCIWLQPGLRRRAGESGRTKMMTIAMSTYNCTVYTMYTLYTMSIIVHTGGLQCGLQGGLWRRGGGGPRGTKCPSWRKFWSRLLQRRPLWLPAVSGLVLNISLFVCFCQFVTC